MSDTLRQMIADAKRIRDREPAINPNDETKMINWHIAAMEKKLRQRESPQASFFDDGDEFFKQENAT